MKEGIINIYKPAGISSFKCLSVVKRKLGLTKVGHLGTLDPLASGVLVLLCGREYTKRANEFHAAYKTYRTVITFGIETTTLDNEGEVTAKSDIIPTRAQIFAILPEMIGKLEIEIPKFSAVHINGARAYDLARKGVDFAAPKKTVEIRRFELLGDTKYLDLHNNLHRAAPLGAHEFYFEIECETGTYIRSLAKLLAAKLGTVAIASTIIRTRVGDFDIEDSVTPDKATLDDILKFKYL